jgi:hypothetical protein
MKFEFFKQIFENESSKCQVLSDRRRGFIFRKYIIGIRDQFIYEFQILLQACT